MDLTKGKAALAGYRWARGDEKERARLYKNQPELREIYVSLPDDKFFLFGRLDTSLWPELIKLDYNILDRSVRSTPTILKALASLSAAESVKAFHYIRDHGTRISIMQRVNAKSRVRVLEGITQASLARMQQLKIKPSNGYFFMSTSRFLATLPSSAQICCSASCLVNNKMSFAELTVLTIAKCLQHSYHKQCAKPRVCCTNASDRVPIEMWDNIARHTSVFTAGLLVHEFGIFPANQWHQRVWYEVFKDDSWLDFVVRNGAHPGLLGSGVHDNSSETAQYLILLLHKSHTVPSEESKRLFYQSIRPYCASDASEHEIIVGGMRLNVRELHNRTILIPNAAKPHQFTYCFYSDAQRKLRLIEPANIISQNGEAFCLKLSFIAQQKQTKIDVIPVVEGEESVLEEREQMCQVLIYLERLSGSYHVRLGDRLPALEGTLYEREIIKLEWAYRRYGNEEYNFASLHPHDFPLV